MNVLMISNVLFMYLSVYVSVVLHVFFLGRSLWMSFPCLFVFMFFFVCIYLLGFVCVIFNDFISWCVGRFNLVFLFFVSIKNFNVVIWDMLECVLDCIFFVSVCIVFVFEFFCMCFCVLVSLNMCEYDCVFVCEWVYVCLFVFVCGREYVCMCLWGSVCMCFFCLCVCMCKCFGIYVCVCICVCVCVCVYVFGCVFRFLGVKVTVCLCFY